MTAPKNSSPGPEETAPAVGSHTPATPAGDEAAAAAEIAAEKDAERGLRPGQSAKNFWPSTKRMLREMGPERYYLLAAIAVGVVSVAFSVVGPRILGRATDIIFTGLISKNLPAGADPADVVAQLREDGQEQFADMLSGMTLTPGEGIDFGALHQTLALAVGLFAVSALLMWLQGLALNRIIVRMVYRLRRDVEEKLHRLPLAYFDRMKRGEILSRVTNDIDNIQNTLMNTVTGLVNSILTVCGVLLMMLTISWQLSLIALAVIPVALVLTGVVGKRAQKLFAQQWDATGVVNSEVEEAYTGHALVTVFGRRDEITARFEERNENLFRATFGAQFVSSLIMPLMMFVGNLSYVAVAIVGGLRIVSGQLTLGDVQAFIQYSRQFTQPLSQVASMATMLQSGVASAERVFELLDAEEQEPETTEDTAAAGIREGRVEFEHVRFSYTPERELIRDLSLIADPGHTVAIVGPTGAGKTTLVNLVMRFYEVDGGRITIDGIDIRDLTRAQLRERTGMVLQDTWLFKGSLRENIRYGRLDATDEEVIEAARATHVDDFARQLPEGYDTVVDDDETSLSAGEKQLVTIARAFLARPSLLILDEATSSVDTRTEVLVQNAMNRLRQGRTSFVIAHRLSTIRDADLILVMEDGDIVEQGDHDELLALGGAYARLYRSQFEGAAVDIDAEEELAGHGAEEEAPTTTGGMALGG
ncbi:Lipid A export ATP-binding/permease protein MsbA [Brachybacterium faecium]|uniref:Fatty acid ABC transporter ATP-binding/permease protein n=1 Tax=Brachybacterium faecium (strain ATCC 43885 / DSM 4810 / JCM 11609 / LMG 19847 / NBRC 14762 / NCIMB 9860 / 6-10) TaxID=446465 RepID=C7MH43_BRAFD|nr:ABC transporter ATP-binding protein [Brachybacterium faecium]ACU86491.1 ABC-type multidrug transport system, ATPase and permease component [Brachybacterium faecium DSM 4810]SLN01453.1 Lipid A export ATP-binding/permease protein MsbA [Brachybacterium faecium]